ncbi:helix-turn-helix transcriptional regulator [Burkholderia sp. SCN-KJ]|uniref:helix-turn-helix transcriptional regulator n=1 Tax=Burkholderia sp. SCN-KJ TaxID=2969248 RepID=UPI00214F6391|nr:helix-turn-helix transcriptional regulator [Burkholderia sp. SCN-KJ]MCR4468153.1 helix-turn-helix transcriptional regulator [Burkholderia sp. SCN-KJ]
MECRAQGPHGASRRAGGELLRARRAHRHRRPFSLTRAEPAVATGIAGGLTPAEYAACNGVQIGTVLSPIKAVFAKTGARRIADLVALSGA